MKCTAFCLNLLVISCVSGLANCSLPTCVEIIDVVPHRFYKRFPRFLVFFSKPVSRLNPKTDAFITPSLLDVRQHRPTYSRPHGSSLQQYEFRFSLSIQQAAVYRNIYFVIDGGSFYASKRHFSGSWSPYVPLSVFGPYRLSRSNSINSQPILPSPHCYPREKQFYFRPLEKRTPIRNITLRSARLVKNDGEKFEVQVSLDACSNCEGMLELPEIITAWYKGRHTSVLLPGNTVVRVRSQQKSCTIPVDSRTIHEVFERTYRSRIPGPVQQIGSVPSNIPYLIAKFNRDRTFSLTNRRIKTPFYHTLKRRNSRDSVKYLSYSASFTTKSKSKSYRPYNPVWHKCNSSSIRSADTAQPGSLYHSLELGPFYYMLTPSLRRRKNWGSAEGSTSVKVNNEDVSSSIFFSSYIGIRTMIPQFIREKLSRYTMLVPPLVNKQRRVTVKQTLKDAIFVPTQMLNKKCGGVLLDEQLDKLQTDTAEFCNKTFGHCVGLPFSSFRRFPNIPPFGVDGLSITKTSKNVKVSINSWVPLIIRSIPIKNFNIMYPRFDDLSCTSIWRIEHSLSTDTRLYLRLTNSGEGGADVRGVVRCTSLLYILPVSGIKNSWIGPHKTSDSIGFIMDASRATAVSRQPHKCNMTLIIFQPTLNETRRTITCSRIITTYLGQFQDPCTVTESILPDFSLKYFVLPPSQRESTLQFLHTFLQSEIGKDLSFVKAITVSLHVLKSQEHLLSNFNQLRVMCNPSAVVLLEEQELVNIVTKTRVEDGKTNLGDPTLNYYSSLTTNKIIYYFVKRTWLSDVQNGRMKISSGCVIELFANRPSRQCYSNSVRLKALIVPLVQSDVPALMEQVRGEHWYLNVIYGDQPREIIETLLGCLVLAVFMFGITFVSHCLLLSCRKRLPNRNYLRSSEKKLKTAMRQDKKRWENHQMYLEVGKYGTFYTLHGFMCTHPLDDLDEEGMKAIKIAGLIKYKDKEQQIIFGHVKKVFVSRKHGSGDILVQASSGMYLLKAKNVSEDYEEELNAFYKSRKIVVKEEEEE